MSKRHQKWHYEHLPVGDGLSKIAPYRIADEEDDYIDRVATEKEAQIIVREHNANVPPVPDTWKY